MGTVNIVRKDHHVQDLKDNLHAEHVLNQESPTFFEDLKALCDLTQPTILFECLGGELPGKVFAKMPPKSIMVVYGSLTKQNVQFDSLDFRWGDKNITSLILFRYITSIPKEERQKWFERVALDLHTGGAIFGSTIVKEVPLEEWESAIPESEKVASEGKYLIKCIRE